MWGAAGGAQAFNIELMKRLPELFQKAHPKVIPCDECGRPIPAKKAIIRDNKVICEKCYERLYPSKHIPPRIPRAERKRS
ncbi:hypothetical protein KAU55_01150 [Candidatus Bathyarchaeota archaeon]|nr:hypothetical protein [Candidatus Bathyarchaeota archaeon]